VLTENGIEESGTHEELIAKNGIYSELYSLYTEI
jgi:ATP-binding cassette subfamily B protein